MRSSVDAEGSEIFKSEGYSVNFEMRDGLVYITDIYWEDEDLCAEYYWYVDDYMKKFIA